MKNAQTIRTKAKDLFCFYGMEVPESWTGDELLEVGIGVCRGADGRDLGDLSGLVPDEEQFTLLRNELARSGSEEIPPDTSVIGFIVDSYTCGPVLHLAQKVRHMDTIPQVLAEALENLAEVQQHYAGQDGPDVQRAVKDAEQAVQEAAGDLWPGDEE